MNKSLLLCLCCFLFLSLSVFGQEHERNFAPNASKLPNDNGNNHSGRGELPPLGKNDKDKKPSPTNEGEKGRTNLILPHGNIGLGTLSPSEKLEVLGNIRVSKGIFAKSLHVDKVQVATLTVEKDIFVGRNILLEGNLGIGVSNPAERLDIQGNIRVSDGIVADNTKSKTLSVEDGNFSNQLKVKNLFTVDGLTGLGVSSPQEKLDVGGNIKTSGSFIGQDLQVRTGAFSDDITVSRNMAVEGNALFKGNLGIGTENLDGYTLSVDGKIRASGDIRVYPAGEWADYVFAEEYALRPLREVAAYINHHKHLPDLPSATEVQQEGIQLGEMDARLLQKIEELTLYIIQLEQENRQAKNENKEMAEQLKSMQSEISLIKENLGIR